MMQSYGAYAVLLHQDFGWSKSLLAGAFAMTRVESGLLGPLQGWLADRYGPRIVLVIGHILFGIGFIVFSQIDSILGFYASWLLIAIGSSLGGFLTLMVPIVQWFDHHRSKAIAISQMGYALSGICIPIVIFALATLGWRTTALLSGIMILIVGIPLSFVVRHRPQSYRFHPDGYNPGGRSQPAHSDKSPVLDMSARQALRTRAFWLISAGHALSLLIVSAVSVHVVFHLTEGLHYSLAHAGFVIALMTACQLAGQAIGGYLGDRFEKRIICATCLISHAIALLFVTFAVNWQMVVVFAVLHGLGWGVRGPLMIALRADYFGTSSFGTIMGFSSLIVMVGMSTGALVTGFMADITHNYILGFSTMAFVSVFGSFCFLMAKRPERVRLVSLDLAKNKE